MDGKSQRPLLPRVTMTMAVTMAMALDIISYLHGEVGVGVEELRTEGQEQLLVGVDDVRRLDERLRAHRLQLDEQTTQQTPKRRVISRRDQRDTNSTPHQTQGNATLKCVQHQHPTNATSNFM